MNLLKGKRIETGYVLIGALLFSCLYIWPLRIVWIDKFVITLIVTSTLLKRKKRFLQQQKSNQSFQINLPSIIITYFVVRDLFSLYSNANYKTFRWVIVHIITLIFFLFYRKINLRYETIYAILILYSIVSLVNYVVMTLTGYNWEALQGVIISGSIISSIPFVVAILIVCSTFSNFRNMREISLLYLVMINGIVYQSRTTILLVFISLGLILFKSKVRFKSRIRLFLPISFITVCLSFFGNTFHSDLQAAKINAVSEGGEISNYLSDIRDTALLLIKNRDSDSDRVQHLKCGLKFASKRDFPMSLFGSGANSFRYEIEKCSEFGGEDEIAQEIEYVGNGSRSVSFTILIIDYGVVGIGLIFVGIIINLRNQFLRKHKYDAIASILFSYLLLVANVNDILLVWLLLFFSVGISDISKNRYRN